MTIQLSVDGAFYLRAARGEPVPSPYVRRWLLPALCGDRPGAWALVSWASLAATAWLVGLYAGHPLAAAVLFLGLPVARFNARCPVLVDAPAMALALGAAVAWQRGHVAWALALAMLSGACKESGPVFAAVYAGAPWLLCGLAAARWWGGSPVYGTPYLGPLRGVAVALWRERRHAWGDWRAMLLPWGALAVLGPMGAAWDRATLVACAALGIGYAQLLIATDEARLFQWAAPCVIALGVRCPNAAIAVGCVWHVFNPYRGV